MKTVRLLAFTAALGVSLAAARGAAQTILYKFGGSPDGATPEGLVAGPKSVLYGTTAYGGTSGYGTVFQLAPPAKGGAAWIETVLYRFTNQNGDGANPFASVTVGPKGEIYGTTAAGGSNGLGTVYELQPPAVSGGTWTETVLYSVDGDEDNGFGLYRGVVVGPHGELYGVFSSGGSGGNGIVFELSPPATAGAAWTFSVLYTFSDGGDGHTPVGLTIGSDGVLYGTTSYGGSSGAGTVFALTAPAAEGGWTETVLYNFTGLDDGAAPLQPPVLASGAIYGTASGGGSIGSGTVFELTPPAVQGGTWTYTVIYNLGHGDGELPDSPLTVHNGTVYGTTATGSGAGNTGGTVFELQPPTEPGGSWTETVLHNFTGQIGPYGSLFVDKSGALFGATSRGPGANGAGFVYRIKP